VKTAKRIQGLQAFYALWGGQLISVIGSGMTRFGLSVWILAEGGILAGSVGALIGVGTGRGMGFMFILIGLIVFGVVLLSWLNRSIRLLEDRLPDYEIG